VGAAEGGRVPDGRTALDNGTKPVDHGPEARADGHAWRRRASAVLSGIGTVLADDPRLDVRLVPTAAAAAARHRRFAVALATYGPSSGASGVVLVAATQGHAGA